VTGTRRTPFIEYRNKSEKRPPRVIFIATAVYYNERWQVLERRSTESVLTKQFAWCAGCVDKLVRRDRLSANPELFTNRVAGDRPAAKLLTRWS